MFSSSYILASWLNSLAAAPDGAVTHRRRVTMRHETKNSSISTTWRRHSRSSRGRQRAVGGRRRVGSVGRVGLVRRREVGKSALNSQNLRPTTRGQVWLNHEVWLNHVVWLNYVVAVINGHRHCGEAGTRRDREAKNRQGETEAMHHTPDTRSWMPTLRGYSKERPKESHRVSRCKLVQALNINTITYCI